MLEKFMKSGLSFKFWNLLALSVIGKLDLHTTTNTMTDKVVTSGYSGDLSISAVFITCPNEDEAKNLASKMVEQKLVACVNIIPGVKSIYEWKGKIEEDSEVIMMLKTRSTRVDEISSFIRENHSYDVAEVISTKIENGNAPYLDWILKTVPAKQNQ